MGEREERDKNMLTMKLLGYLPLALPFYLVRFRIGPLPTTMLEMYLGVLFLVFFYEYGLRGIRDGWRGLRAFRWPVIAWLVATLVAVCFSPNAWTGFGLWRAYVLEPLFVFFILHAVEYAQLVRAAVSIKSEKTGFVLKENIVRSLFCVTIILAGWALVQFVTGWGIPHPWDVSIAAGRRATGPFPYPNALALFVVPVGSYVLSYVSRRTSHVGRLITWLRTYALALGALVATLAGTLLARSDGGLIALVAVTWLTLVLQKRWRIWVLGMTLVGLFAAALLPALHKPIVNELTFQGWSGKVRMYMWRDTRAMLHDHWFFGAGFGGYPKLFKGYQRTTGIEVFQYPHNILLNFWSETGVLGVMAFASILVVLIWRLKERGWREGILRLLPFFAIIIHGLVDVPYFKNDLAILFWLLVWLSQEKLGDDQGLLSDARLEQVASKK